MAKNNITKKDIIKADKKYKKTLKKLDKKFKKITGKKAKF